MVKIGLMIFGVIVIGVLALGVVIAIYEAGRYME